MPVGLFLQFSLVFFSLLHFLLLYLLNWLRLYGVVVFLLYLSQSIFATVVPLIEVQSKIIEPAIQILLNDAILHYHLLSYPLLVFLFVPDCVPIYAVIHITSIIVQCIDRLVPIVV